MSFADNLRQAISYTGLEQKDVAAMVGLPLRSLQSYLKRKKPSIPSADVAVRLARILGVTVEYFVTGSDSRKASLSSVTLQNLTDDIVRDIERDVKTRLETLKK
jgi:transcriptional regulator with XRE-family HTH domain